MTSSFLQVGRTIRCGHCANFEVPEGVKCDCVCHDKLKCQCERARNGGAQCMVHNPPFPIMKHTCCNGECHHDDCCGKVPENCHDKEFKLDFCPKCGVMTNFLEGVCQKHLDKISCPRLHLEDIQAFLPMFIADTFPAGKKGDRGAAILYVALFLDWMKKNVKNK